MKRESASRVAICFSLFVGHTRLTFSFSLLRKRLEELLSWLIPLKRQMDQPLTKLFFYDRFPLTSVKTFTTLGRKRQMPSVVQACVPAGTSAACLETFSLLKK